MIKYVHPACEIVMDRNYDSDVGVYLGLLGQDKTESEIFAFFYSDNMDPLIINQMMHFVQNALGRAFLHDLGIHFNDTYIAFDCDGELYETGKLSGHPLYLAAEKLALYAIRQGQTYVVSAVGSPEVQAVNELMNKGAHPGDIMTSPMVYFAAPPTDEALIKVNDYMKTVIQPEGKQ